MKIEQHSQTKIDVTLPDGPATEIYTQFGMRYPDGTIKWGYDHEQYGGSIGFENIGERITAESWRKRLERRAAAASIQFSEYLEGHEALQRTIIVAVTEAKES